MTFYILFKNIRLITDCIVWWKSTTKWLRPRQTIPFNHENIQLWNNEDCKNEP